MSDHDQGWKTYVAIGFSIVLLLVIVALLALCIYRQTISLSRRTTQSSPDENIGLAISEERHAQEEDDNMSKNFFL